MRKQVVYPVKQKNKTFFALITDPRDVAELIVRSKDAEAQDNQRPWKLEKVKEIARYVVGWIKIGTATKRFSGLLPGAPIVCLTDGIMKIEQDALTGEYYIMFPETEAEFAECANSIEVIDGQHRILAFAKDLRDPEFSDDTPYEMIFSVFEPLGTEEKKQIFVVTNEKQDKVENNLLRLFRKQLHLLAEDEKYFDLVCLLNSEDYSPLKDRIMIGATKIPKGYKESQLSKILNKSEAYEKMARMTGDDVNKMCNGLSLYLSAWETVKGIRFRSPGKETLTKISGIRYILYLFQYMLDIIKEEGKSATKESFIELIQMLPDATGIQDVFSDPETSLAFRGEGATVKLAKDHGNQLVAAAAKNFKLSNPTSAW